MMLKLYTISIMLIIGTFSFVAMSSASDCNCENSEQVQVIDVWKFLSHSPEDISDCNIIECEVTLEKLIKCSSNLNVCERAKFMIHPGAYFVARNSRTNASKRLKTVTTDVTIVGLPNATINCEDNNTSLFISQIFAKAHNTMIYDLCFYNCTNIQITLDIKSTTIHVSNCTFINSSLNITFKKFDEILKSSEIVVNNTNIYKCNTNPFIKISFTVRKTVIVTFQDLNMTESWLPLYEFKNQSNKNVAVFFRQKINFFCNRNVMLHINDCSLTFCKAHVKFSNNMINNGIIGEPLYAENSLVTFEESQIEFTENSGTFCGGIRASDNTQIIFNDDVNISFSKNSGSHGGALSLYTKSRVVFNATMVGVNVNFTENRARISGGAIYVEDSEYGDVKSVFDLQGDSKLINLLFKNNYALFGGHQIHGGWIDFTPEQTNINDILEFHSDNDSDVASNPVRICLCKDNHVNCSLSETTQSIQGCSLNLAIVAVGQRFTPVLAYVEAFLQSSKDYQVMLSPRIQSLQKSCTNIKYKISVSKYISLDATLVLRPNPSYERLPQDNNTTDTYESLFKDLTIHLKKRNCTMSLGYVEMEGDCECVCLPSLKSIGIDCNYTSELKTIIVKNAQQWVGVTKAHTAAGMNEGVIAHIRCPLSYCRTNPNKSLTFLLEDQDQQCAFNRSGILCGGCKTNFSRVLGSIKCKKCTNGMLLLMIFSFILAGVILVVALTTLDLTVSVGTINGLIFYANIIQIQRATFFHSAENTTKFLSTFIAWLNLDLGIESCFFDGLDSYIETWLQFCFPLYIWMIVFAIIITSHYSSRVSKLCGRNIVQVLATLLLLSYTKLFVQAVDVFRFEKIKYPSGYVKAVWAYDGNIDFLRGKHIPLFLTTVLLQTVLTVVFPLCLVNIQCLQKISHLRGMFWINRLKPFFDAYTGPCKASHRYWPGFLLIMRISVLLIVTINHHKSTVILLALTIISFVMLAYFGAVKGIYNNWIPNCLEILFLCNLGVTSAVHVQSYLNAEYSSVPITISVAFAFTFFVGILLYHALQQILHTKLGAQLKNRAAKIINIKKNERSMSTSLQDLSMPTTNSTVVELKEPLIE